MNRREQRMQIVGASHLVNGQNFYDQVPFKNAVSLAIEDSEFTEQHIHRGISYAVGRMYSPTGSTRYPGFESQDARHEFFASKVPKLPRTNQIFSWEPDVKHLSVKAFQERKKAFVLPLLTALDLLEPFPLWGQYVNGKRESAGFDENGVIRVGARRPNILVPEPTYPSWLVEQHASHGRRRDWGIQDITEDTDPQELARGTGVNAGRRRWLIYNHTV